MSFERIRHRLQSGRPLVVDSDTAASFRARGVALDSPGALGSLLRERPQEVLDHYRAEVESRVDVLSALTGDTTPRALAEVGMQHRAAQLTGRAVEFALEAALESAKPVAVAGVLGSDMVSPIAADRIHEELAEHASRLAVAGCELLLARGQGSKLGLMAAVAAASATELPTWAVLEYRAPEELVSGNAVALVESLSNAGADVVLFEVPTVDLGLAALEHFRAAFELHGIIPGVLLAGSDASVRGFHDEESDPERWVERAVDLSQGGARVIGGGAGTTEAHTQWLAKALGSLHPSLPLRRSDSELDRGPGGW
ncbi:MAG TPA: homocysteine S-methyltransferase family protein [Polyangiaceae bacterium]|jgi:5-methyltetrahydrofolate--homocysteine methyltransferase|nr:homocysteine S-methyltransferase family protein [Polyangiaceae bacterium]